MKKNVCHIALRHPLFDTRVFFKEALPLSQAGYHITIVAKKSEGTAPVGIEAISCDSFFTGLRLLLSKKFDAYHVHDQTSLLLGIILCSIKRTPLIYDIHEHYFLFPRLRRGWKKRILNLVYAYIIEPLGIQLADLCIGVTPTMQRVYGKKSKRFLYFPNYYVGEMSATMPVENREAPFKNRFVLLYQGGMKRERGIYQYIDIVDALRKSFPNILLAYIGPFDGAEDKELFMQTIEKKQLQDSVWYGGALPFQDVGKYTAQADVGLNFLANSLNNNLGIQNKLFEYLAHGLPIFSSDNVEFVRDILVPQGLAVIAPYDNVAISVTRLSEMLAQKESYVQSVIQYRAGYQQQQYIPSLIAAYKEIVG